MLSTIKVFEKLFFLLDSKQKNINVAFFVYETLVGLATFRV